MNFWIPFEFLYGINEWVLFVVLAALLLGAVEVSFLYGRYIADRRADDGLRDRVAALGNTLIGSLALFIGFTFSMALSRFDSRKQAFQREVNDIGTAYLHTGLLPEKDAALSRELFGRYVDCRVHRFWWRRPQFEELAISSETDKYQKQLWAICTRNAKTNLLVHAYQKELASVFSDRTSRAIALDNHVPEAILWLMVFFALSAMATAGYASGLRKARAPLVRLVLILTMALTLLAIVDLDRPRRGLVRIDQKPMAHLRDSILEQNIALGIPVPKISAEEILPVQVLE